MPRQLFILDLDRTVFDTDRFFEDIKAALHRTHKLDINQFTNTYKAFIDPENGGYDLHRHHNELLGLTPDELDDFIKQELGDRDYTYPDAAAWINSHSTSDTDIVIVTVGRPRFQELKFHHCKPVQRLHKVVMSTNKGGVIHRHITGQGGEYGLGFLDQPYREIFLVDDNPDTFTALRQTGRITAIRIARPGEKYSRAQTLPGIRQITSFGDLK